MERVDITELVAAWAPTFDECVVPGCPVWTPHGRCHYHAKRRRHPARADELMRVASVWHASYRRR